MSNLSPPDFSHSEPKTTRAHAGPSTARRSGASDGYQTFRNLLKASENNRLASENNLRASENIVRATERGIQAADHTIEAAKEFIRRAEDAGRVQEDAGLDPHCAENLYTDDVGHHRSLDPDILLNRWPDSRRTRNSLLTFSSWGLVLCVSAAAIVTYLMAAKSPSSWNPSENEHTADAIAVDSQSIPEPAEATNPPASPAATVSTASDQTGAAAVARQLDRDEIAMLVQHGEQFAMAGDLAAARLMLLRAAEAGDPRASLSLAATYDPIVLERLGVRGISGDLALARTWYEKAKAFGSAEASQLLERLAGRGQ